MFTLHLYKGYEVLVSYVDKKKPVCSVGPYSDLHLEVPLRTSLKEIHPLLHKFRHDFRKAKPATTKTICYGKYEVDVEESPVQRMQLCSEKNVLLVPAGTPIYKAFFYILHLSGELQQYCYFTLGTGKCKIEFDNEEEVSLTFIPKGSFLFRTPFFMSAKELQNRAELYTAAILNMDEVEKREESLFKALEEIQVEHEKKSQISHILCHDDRIKEQVLKKPALNERIHQILINGVTYVTSLTESMVKLRQDMNEVEKIHKKIYNFQEYPQGVSLQMATDCLTSAYEDMQEIQKKLDESQKNTKELRELERSIESLSKESAKQDSSQESSNETSSQESCKENSPQRETHEEIVEFSTKIIEDLKELARNIESLAKESAKQDSPQESSSENSSQRRAKEEVLEGIAKLLSNDTEKKKTVGKSPSTKVPSTSVTIDGRTVFVEFTEEEPLPRFAQDEQGRYRLSVPPNASPDQLERFAEIYIRAEEYWNHTFTSEEKASKKEGISGTLRDLTIDIDFTNLSTEPSFSQKAENRYLLSLHPLTSIELAKAYAYLYARTEILKREAALKTVSYNDFTVQLEFANTPKPKLSQNADGSYSLRMPKGSSYTQAEAFLKDYYEKNLANRQNLPPKETNKPHYALPFISVTPQGKTTVYMPTDDEEAKAIFLDTHWTRVETMISFIQEEYRLPSDGKEPIALLFDDLDVIAWHKNVKNIRFQISPKGKIEAILPPHYSFNQAFQYIVTNHDMASRSLENALQFYNNRETIKVWGKEYKLDISVSNKLPAVQIQGDTVYLHLSEEKQSPVALLQPWYSSLLQTELEKLLEEYIPKMGVRIRSYTPRLMTKLWGSYSAKTESISINFKLIQYPLRCLRGVLIHILAHSLVQEHTPEFYQIIERFCPDWKEIDAELQKDTTMTY